MKNPFLENFRSYIPDKTSLRELSVLPLVVGTLLGILFGASSLYLVLKTGLTVSASIPVAVIAITLFRILSKLGARDATILEGNIMQTAGSAGESIAFGVGVTMPAIMILGFDLDLMQSTLVAVFGGLLGILLMIPLRRALIKEQHGYLKYPEGTACAEVLKAGASKESRDASHEGDTTADDSAALQGGKIIGVGFAMGFVYNVAMQVFSLWNPEPSKKLSDSTIKGGSVALENNPALLGVGYIIGPYVAGLMLGGGVLSYLVLIPLIKFFGETAAAPIAPELSKTIGTMSAGEIRGSYILYIGAGAVAAAGIISLARSLPTIWSGLKSGLADLTGGATNADGSKLPRTDQDISMKWVIAGIIGLIGGILLLPPLGISLFQDWKVSIVAAILILVLGFLFVTVSSRLTGEIGSSSNPISGMTVATLLITSLVFLMLGWTAADPYFVSALSIGGIVCIAASNGGTTSQDLKTGFWVGGTPRNQQVAILFGALASALVLGWLLVTLNNAETYYHKVAEKEFATGFRVKEEQLFRERGAFKSEVIVAGKYKDTDQNAYRVWQNTDPAAGPVGKYLVDMQGKPAYLVDPGINGQIKIDEDGKELTRYDAPKATLMSYIIKGILSQQLPWGLVLIGAMIAIMLELAGVPSLAFAVGLYLPISTSTPIFFGGMVRWAVDIYLRKKFARQNLTKEQIDAETDKSNGVLLASGYIAGGAIAGIMVALFSLDKPAFLQSLKAIKDKWAKWAETGNPFFAGDNADVLGMIPFLILTVILYFVGREIVLAGKKKDA
jgi:putative OPT family oligopeptide transporter